MTALWSTRAGSEKRGLPSVLEDQLTNSAGSGAGESELEEQRDVIQLRKAELHIRLFRAPFEAKDWNGRLESELRRR